MNPCFRHEPKPHCCHGRCVGPCKARRKKAKRHGRYLGRRTPAVVCLLLLAAAVAVGVLFARACWDAALTP